MIMDVEYVDWGNKMIDKECIQDEIEQVKDKIKRYEELAQKSADNYLFYIQMEESYEKDLIELEEKLKTG